MSGPGFIGAEVSEVCICRRGPLGGIEVWTGTNWATDSDLAMIFPSQAQVDDYLKAHPALASEANLRTVKTRPI